MHPADEELQADDVVDDDDEEHQQGDVEQRNHRLHDGVQDNLQAWKTCGDEALYRHVRGGNLRPGGHMWHGELRNPVLRASQSFLQKPNEDGCQRDWLEKGSDPPLA